MARDPIVFQRLSLLMKINVPRMVLLGLFAFASMGSASASPMKAQSPAPAAPITAPRAAENPWPSLASMAGEQQAPMLAHDDDRYWRDGRWHDRRDDWRRAQWRREQARREAERRHEWERRHYRARYEHDRRYYDHDRRYYGHDQRYYRR